MKKKFSFRDLFFCFLILAILGLGLFVRLYGLNENFSFWSDENHVAIFSRAILERGKPVLENGYQTGRYQVALYWLVAILWKLFGVSEFTARIPSVFFGMLTTGILYLFAKDLFDKKTAILSMFFMAILNIEILWSRQLRPYQALQFFLILAFYFLYRFTQKGKTRDFLIFLASSLLGVFFHGLGLITFFTGVLFLFFFRRKKIKGIDITCRNPIIYLFPLSLLLFLFIFGSEIIFAFENFKIVNNFSYFRIFLTKNYLLLSLLAFWGGLILFLRKEYKKLFLFILVLGTQFLLVSFFLGQPFIRYFYVVFPFIVLLASFLLLILPRPFFLLFFLFLLFSLKDKISFFPRINYSLNEDMQEIPEVDWKKIYGFVKEKMTEKQELSLVVNWNDLPVWYLGEEPKSLYWLRSSGDGLMEKDPLSGGEILDSLEKLKKVIEEKKAGLLVLDSWDDKVPDGVREYCHQNLKRELEVDRLYEIQPKYWTVWVYSWGLD